MQHQLCAFLFQHRNLQIKKSSSLLISLPVMCIQSFIKDLRCQSATRPGILFSLTGTALCGSSFRHVRLALLGILHGTEGNSHLLHSPAAPTQQSVLYVVPEILRHKVVDEWVQAAVETCQTQSRDVETVSIIFQFVLQ